MAASINDWCYVAEKQMYMSNEFDEEEISCLY
jgi:hypothetical protein